MSVESDTGIDFEVLEAAGAISPFDRAFGRLLRQLDDTAPEATELAACVASNWVGRGHVCAPLARLVGRPLFSQLETGPLGPELEHWRQRLLRSKVVGPPGTRRPLILDDRGRLYLYRYWDYEQRLARALLARAGTAPSALDLTAARNLIERLFGPGDPLHPDLQRRAAGVALLRRLCLVSGGPGTGKTTTVLRVLALLQGLAGGMLRVGLAAPTGKAAARLEASVETGWGGLPASVRETFASPGEAVTLHRLLGLRQNGDARYGPARALPLDLLIVDEASMVDLGLMVRVVEALAPEARLILLGDKDQLASVEAGAVLGDICSGNHGFSATMASDLSSLIGEPVEASPDARGIADSVTLLERSHRFGATSGIGRLAAAVNRGDLSATRIALTEPDDVHWLCSDALSGSTVMDQLVTEARIGYASFAQAVKQDAPPAAVLEAFEGYRILCPHRVGRTGAERVNQAVERALGLGGRSGRAWYPGRPVLISRNDHGMGLFNGDLGIALVEPDTGRLRVFFRTGAGEPRSVAPGRLPEHETAFAMTIHKSQGSEFDRVLVVLPESHGSLLGRELLYTALTRARDEVTLSVSTATLQLAVGHSVSRVSGLMDALATT